MTVSTYLSALSGNAIIRDREKEDIQRSIEALKSRLASYFGDEIKEQFIFGSYTRNTILPRKIDDHSDIDYMVVFKDTDLMPQTYLDKLRRFVETYYTKSEIKQSHPTIQLKLNHIMFELVPALNDGFMFYDDYKIPKKSGDNTWMDTDPNGFKSELTEKNQHHNNLIKPLVRLLKYWNVKNGRVYSSYSLEQWVVNFDFYTGFFESPNLAKYLYQCFEEISTSNLSEADAQKLRRAKEIIKRVKDFEAQDQQIQAETEIKKLLPEPPMSGRQSLLGAVGNSALRIPK